MTAALLALQAVVIATPRGETRVPVVAERGPAIAAPALIAPLRLTLAIEGGRATVTLPGAAFLFDLGVPYVRSGSAVLSLVGAPYVARDTLFLPLQWLAEGVPRVLGGRYRWDAAGARLEELVAPAGVFASAADPHPLTGLRLPHTVVVDPGHGGRDPGNPGLHFPDGIQEKDVVLAIGRLLHAELERRGIKARLTRSDDTFVPLGDRGKMCRAGCDLFVSIHVNSLAGQRSARVSGVETYFLSDAQTEDQKRVAEMENDAIRFETGSAQARGPLAFILRDLQQNEYLRESARLAELIQGELGGVHPGGNRGVQQAGFAVLSTAGAPAILVETGYATHRDDGRYLASSSGQRALALAIADGIVAYLIELERKLAVAGVGR